MGAADEIVAIVDEQNRVVGSATRREMRASRALHRACYILVFNSQGELFLQKRTETKDVYPGRYDPTAGGVVLAGEDYDQSARREIEEEMGVRGVPLHPLFDLYFEDEAVRLWGRVYSCVYDGPVVLQAEEVASGRFLPVEEILRLAGSQPFTPDGLRVLRQYLKRGSSA
ncbi:MAG TPA: NUDIX hydrolase YfcD [Bryobacterales bacterium]|nr:NUDIX hydrolase YfcD [Bryobacterales bacterium]